MCARVCVDTIRVCIIAAPVGSNSAIRAYSFSFFFRLVYCESYLDVTRGWPEGV